ncbi:AraC family transcriptional regulator [Fulvivirga sp. M361]|uniref:AraC family transcriptional regulator n=1 Tax=Fulvivirga sp. M361 TaxID=2594266 RepID=UPI001179BF0D|nr:GyrI-like domain-containing protein [Fulvivirga sp. M361]TRX61859.1 AraC family transcriptional regulator [Fulvivirga sp. M361]
MNPIENKHLVAEYKSRINRVFDYIEANLDKSFSLEELASQANFSKYHFNRIFFAMVRETPFQFINRVRIERSATLLKYNPNHTISEIAMMCGFSDVSIFSRNFKTYFKVSPSAWRKSSTENSNISQTHRNFHQRPEEVSMYFCDESKTIKWRSTMELNQSIEVKNLPEVTVAYIRHTGAYKGNEKLFEQLFNKLCAWAGPRGLMESKELTFFAVYHDDLKVTEEQNLRTSACMTIPPDTKVDGEIGKMKISAGKYAVARFILTAKDYEKAWNWLFGTWLPASGYQPDDGPCFEMYTEEQKDGKSPVDICIPVKPL